MVTHDFERGVIRGLSRAAVDVVRRTGRLPADAVHPAMVELWDAVAASRRYDVPEPTMTDLRRLRDGGAGFGLGEREAFDGEAAPPVWPGDLLGGYRCACWDGLTPVGEGCQIDGEAGTVTEVVGDGKWEWNMSTGWCEMEVTCRSDNPCSCYSNRAGARYLLDASGEYGITDKQLTAACGLDGEELRHCSHEQVKCEPNEDGECECKVWCTSDCASGSWVKLTKNSGEVRTWEPCPDDARVSGPYTKQWASCGSGDISSAMFEDMMATGEAAREAFFEEVQRLEELRAGFAEWWDENVEVADVGAGSTVGGKGSCTNPFFNYYPCDELLWEDGYHVGTKGASAEEAKQRAERLWGKTGPQDFMKEKGHVCSPDSGYESGPHYSGEGVRKSIMCCPCCWPEGGESVEWYCKQG